MKTITKPKVSNILAGIQATAKAFKTNPYQIAKASGLPLTTVQRLLTIKINKPLANVEMLMKAFGVSCMIAASHKPLVQPGSGRGHGKRK